MDEFEPLLRAFVDAGSRTFHRAGRQYGEWKIGYLGLVFTAYESNRPGCMTYSRMLTWQEIAQSENLDATMKEIEEICYNAVTK